VERAITGYHHDEHADWVAELACGHDQHVRHHPPFQQRPWVMSDQGRASRIGSPLSCPLCDRGELPTGLRLVRASPEWDEDTMPASLRRAHRLPARTWGRIVLRHGRLRLTLATVGGLELELAGHGATHGIPPDLDHAVEPLGRVRFSIDLLAASAPATGGSVPTKEPPGQGGDPACWAGMLCPECGIVLDDSPHRSGCPLGPPG